MAETTAHGHGHGHDAAVAVASGDHAQQHPLLSRILVPADQLFTAWPPLREALSGVVTGEQLVYHPAAVALALAFAAALALWLQRLPFHASAEEQLQDALDHQVPAPSGARAS